MAYHSHTYGAYCVCRCLRIPLLCLPCTPPSQLALANYPFCSRFDTAAADPCSPLRVFTSRRQIKSGGVDPDYTRGAPGLRHSARGVQTMSTPVAPLPPPSTCRDGRTIIYTGDSQKCRALCHHRRSSLLRDEGRAGALRGVAEGYGGKVVSNAM